MIEKKDKEGISVKEIEAFTKKYRIEVLLCLMFALACFFSIVFFGYAWAAVATMAGGILGVLIHEKIEHITKASYNFISKQEQTTQIILAVVALVLSIFLPPLIFLLIGAEGGMGLYHAGLAVYSRHE